MVIGLLTFELYIHECHSLKEKRRVVKSVVERIRARYNVSAAEVEKQDIWQEAVVAVAMVSSDKAVIDRTFSTIVNMVEEQSEAEVIRVAVEML